MNNAEFRSQSDKEKESLNKDQNLLINDDNNVAGAEEQVKGHVRSGILENFNNGAKVSSERKGYKDIEQLLIKKEEAISRRKKLLLKRHKKQGIQPEIERIDQELEKVESDLSKNKEIEYTLMTKKVELLNTKMLFNARKERMRAVDIAKIDQKLDEIDLDISNINLCYLGRGNKEDILKDIIDNYIKVKECSKERMGHIIDYDNMPGDIESLGYDPLYKTLRYRYTTFGGVELYVDLPKIGSFEGYRREIFIPILYFYEEYEETLADKNFRIYSIAEFAEALRNYLLEFGIEIDKGENYLHTEYGMNCFNYSTELGRFINNYIRDIEKDYRKKYYRKKYYF